MKCLPDEFKYELQVALLIPIRCLGEGVLQARFPVQNHKFVESGRKLYEAVNWPITLGA